MDLKPVLSLSIYWVSSSNEPTGQVCVLTILFSLTKSNSHASTIATRERPRTSSQTSLSSGVVPAIPPATAAASPPPAQPTPPPAQPKQPVIDLLGDLGGDPFAQPAGKQSEIC